MPCKQRRTITSFLIVVTVYFYTCRVCHSVSLGPLEDYDFSTNPVKESTANTTDEIKQHRDDRQTDSVEPVNRGTTRVDQPRVYGPRAEYTASPAEKHFDTDSDFVLTVGTISRQTRSPTTNSEDGHQAQITDSDIIQGKVICPSIDSSPHLPKWLGMRPLVKCDDSVMTFTATSREFPHLLVDRVGASPLSLFKLPPFCGYTVKRSLSNLEMVAPYDACYIMEKNGSYVLPMLWWGSPLFLACPVQMSTFARRSFHSTPSVFCSAYGMAVEIGGQEHVLPMLGTLMNGARAPFVSEKCAFFIHSHHGDLAFFISSSAPCITHGDRLELHLTVDDQAYTLSCPLASQFPYAPSRTPPGPSKPQFPITPDPISPVTTPSPNRQQTHQFSDNYHYPYLGFHYLQLPQIYPPGSQPVRPLQPTSSSPPGTQQQQQQQHSSYPKGPAKLPDSPGEPTKYPAPPYQPPVVVVQAPYPSDLSPAKDISSNSHQVSKLPDGPSQYPPGVKNPYYYLHTARPPTEHTAAPPPDTHGPAFPTQPVRPQHPVIPFHSTNSSSFHHWQLLLPKPGPVAQPDPQSTVHFPKLPAKEKHPSVPQEHEQSIIPKPGLEVQPDPQSTVHFPKLPAKEKPPSVPQEPEQFFIPKPGLEVQPDTQRPVHIPQVPAKKKPQSVPQEPVAPRPTCPPNHHTICSPYPYPYHHSPYPPPHYYPSPHPAMPIQQPQTHLPFTAEKPYSLATVAPTMPIPAVSPQTEHHIQARELQCLKGGMVAFLPFANPKSIQVRDKKKNNWLSLSDSDPQCGFMLQMAEGYGVILHSPLPSCHSWQLTPTIVSLLLRFWDHSTGEFTTMDLQCPFKATHETPAVTPSVSPFMPSITKDKGPSAVPKPKVLCFSDEMKVELPPGLISEIVIGDIKGNYINIRDAPEHCGYSARKGKNGKIRLSLQLHSHCHASVQGKMFVILVNYMTVNGRHEAHFSCPVLTQVSGQECNLPSEQHLPCGSGSVSQQQCHSMGCCYSKRPPSCYYPMDECSIDRHFVFYVPATFTEPPLTPALLIAAGNSSCRPQIVTNDYAIFKIPMDGCGTHRIMVGKTIIYMVEVVNKVHAISLNYGIITRDSPVRLFVECRFTPGTILSASYIVTTPTLGPQVQKHGAFGVQLRISKDSQYSSYHPQYHQPLRMLLGKPLYLEVRLLNSPDPSLVLLVHFCVAYPRSAKAVWVLLYNGCPNPHDPAQQQAVLFDPQPPSPHGQTRRFTVSTFHFLTDGEFKDLDEEIYFMCSTEICSPRDGPCVEGCFSH